MTTPAEAEALDIALGAMTLAQRTAYDNGERVSVSFGTFIIDVERDRPPALSVFTGPYSTR